LKYRIGDYQKQALFKYIYHYILIALGNRIILITNNYGGFMATVHQRIEKIKLEIMHINDALNRLHEANEGRWNREWQSTMAYVRTDEDKARFPKTVLNLHQTISEHKAKLYKLGG
jgi:hypothetical protein